MQDNFQIVHVACVLLESVVQSGGSHVRKTAVLGGCVPLGKSPR